MQDKLQEILFEAFSSLTTEQLNEIVMEPYQELRERN